MRFTPISFIIISKTIMNKRSQQILQSQSNLNTLDNYFKNKEIHQKQLAKLPQDNFKEQSLTNPNTNSSSHRTELLPTQPYDEQSSQNAINFNQLKNIKNPILESSFIQDNPNSHTCQMQHPQKIKIPNHDDSPTRDFKEVVSEAIKEEIKKQSPQQETAANISLSIDSSSDFMERRNEKINHNLKVEQILRKQPLAKKRNRTCAKLTKSIIYSTKLTAEQITTSGCIHYHQIGQYEQKLYYTLLLLVNYIKEPFFDKLRTEKEIADYLRAYHKYTRGILSLCFILISSNTEPRAISNHITDFCNTFLANAETDLTAQKFQTIKKSVRTKILQPHNSLKDYFKFICTEIDRKTFLFNRKQEKCLEQYLSCITKEDVLNLFRRSLEKAIKIRVVSKGHEEEYDKVAEKLNEFKQIKDSLEYHPEWQGVTYN